MKRNLSFFAILCLLTACNAPGDNQSIKNSVNDTTQMTPTAKPSLEEVQTKKNDTILNSFVDQSKVKVSSAPKFIHNRYSNYYSFRPLLSDTVVLDYVSQKDLEKCGAVFLKEQDFGGDNVPFLCYVSKEIKSFYLDHKKIHFTPEKEFFFRQRIELYIGYNRVPIRMVNKRNEETESYLEINMERTN
jgi:hypothetical protein